MYDDENIFAKMLRGDIPCDRVYEDDDVLAFNDINPAARVHVLVIPKEKYISLDDFIAHAGAEAVHRFFTSVRKIAYELGLIEGGFRLITNHGQHGNQTVHHFHVHILGGEQLGGF